MRDVYQIYYDNHFMMFVNQIIRLYTLHRAVCQLYLIKIRRILILPGPSSKDHLKIIH